MGVCLKDRKYIASKYGVLEAECDSSLPIENRGRTPIIPKARLA